MEETWKKSLKTQFKWTVNRFCAEQRPIFSLFAWHLSTSLTETCAESIRRKSIGTNRSKKWNEIPMHTNCWEFLSALQRVQTKLHKQVNIVSTRALFSMWMCPIRRPHTSCLAYCVCCVHEHAVYPFRFVCPAQAHYCRNHRILEVKRHEQQPVKQEKKKEKTEENNRIYVISFHSQLALAVFFSLFFVRQRSFVASMFFFVLWHTVCVPSMCAKSIDLTSFARCFCIHFTLIMPNMCSNSCLPFHLTFSFHSSSLTDTHTLPSSTKISLHRIRS